MTWFGQVIFYLGMFDAAVVMFGGVITAFVILMGWDARALYDRLWPATAALVLSNIAAAIILYVTKLFIGG